MLAHQAVALKKTEAEMEPELLAVAEATRDGFAFTLPLIIPDTEGPLRAIRFMRMVDDIAVAAGGMLQVDVSDGVLHPLVEQVWLLPRRALRPTQHRPWTHVTLLVWEHWVDEDRATSWDGTCPMLTPRGVARLAGPGWKLLLDGAVDALDNGEANEGDAEAKPSNGQE